MTYVYICGECDHTFDRTLLMSERELPFREDCPACDVSGSIKRNFVGEGVAAIDPVRLGRVKPDRDFRDHLDNIHKHHGTAPQPTAGNVPRKRTGSLWEE